MKIRLITFHTPINYGAVLQAYALQHYLKGYSDDVKIIDYNTKALEKKYKFFSSKKNPRALIKNIVTIKDYWKYKNKIGKFKSFTKNFLELTNRVENPKEITESLKGIDYVFSGSDQVFNPNRIQEEQDVFYLDFDVLDAKRVAYSPSFGVADIPYGKKKEITNKLNRFYRLSAREEQGVNIIKKLTDRDVEQTVDPVLLLKKADWEKIMEPIKYKKDYILCYSLFDTALEKEIVKKIKKKLGLDVILVTKKSFPRIDANKVIRDASPTEFLYLIKNAKYIITDSFHGIVFSTIFNKDFNLVIGDNNTASRMKSYLNKVKLTNRICSNANEIDTSKIEYQNVNKIIKEEVEKSKDYIDNALHGKDIKKTESIKNEKNNISIIANLCTGCGLCKNICPTHAIRMEIDKEGFEYPIIDETKCIKCNKCLDFCHIKDKNKIPTVSKSYMARSKDFNTIANSSSGGIFYHLAKNLIDKEGIVYGAVLDNKNWTLEHKSSEQVKLEAMMKSKYVQSKTSNVIENIIENIKNGKKVLFSGTPCQTAAIKKCVKDDINLYTIDFICHGVPSIKVFRDKIKLMEKKYKSKVTNVNFRNKYNNWSEQKMYMEFENGSKYLMSGAVDDYFYLFLKNLILRKACYHCKYSNEQHSTDITLADYWGINKYYPELNDEKGYSLIIVNTKKGEQLLNNIKENIDIQEIEWDKAKYVYKTHEDYPEQKRDDFLNDLEKYGLDMAFKKLKRRDKAKTKIKKKIIGIKYYFITKKLKGEYSEK